MRVSDLTDAQRQLLASGASGTTTCLDSADSFLSVDLLAQLHANPVHVFHVF